MFTRYILRLALASAVVLGGGSRVEAQEPPDAPETVAPPTAGPEAPVAAEAAARNNDTENGKD